MEEKGMKLSNFQSSAPQSETISPAIPKEGTIEEALEILDDSNWTNVEQFLRPWGTQKVTLVHLAAYRGQVDMLNRAVALGALRSTSMFHLYDLDGFGRSAFHHAADQGHINVIEWLMDQPAAHEGPSERTSSTEDQASPSAFGSNTVPHQDVETKPQETALLVEQSEDDMLRKRSPSSFDIPDKNGWTPLHAAVYGGHLECVRILIKRGLCLANATKTGVTVMKAIFEEVPHPTAFLKEILDKQVSMAEDSDHEVKMDFAILTALPNYARVPEAKSTGLDKLLLVLALARAVRKTEDREILEHPLVETFIYQKFSFTILLQGFIFLLEILYGTGSFYFYYDCGISWMSNYRDCSVVAEIFASVLCVLIVLIQTANFSGTMSYTILRRSLVKSNKNIIKNMVWESVILTIVITILLRTKFLMENTTACALLIIFYCFLILTRLCLLPDVGPYLIMFKIVLWNILKVLGIFSVLITGFAMTFSLLFLDIGQFNTPWKALGKTLVMMTVEYDYNDLFSSTHKSDVAPSVETEAVLFSIFLKVVGIVLMNLIIGLAVNDIERLLKKSRGYWLQKQTLSGYHWLGSRYLISRGLTRRENGEQTQELTRTVPLDLKSTSRIPWLRLPKQVKNGLLELALKNSSNRDEKYQADLLRDDIRESLTALRTTMIAEIRSIQSSLRGVVVEQQLQNCQIQQLTQNRMTKR